MTRADTAVPEALSGSLPVRGASLRQRRELLQRALRLRPWMADRVLARWCGVSRELVAKTRAAMQEAGDVGMWAERVGGDGKRYHFENSKPERMD